MFSRAVFFTSLIVASFLLSGVFFNIYAHQEEGSGVVIHVDENGFFPNEVTIKLGETVTFENSGSAEHWPASDIHPSHGIYPEFDPMRGLVPGERWAFTFDQAGSWRMHDHLNPTGVGMIHVQDGEKRQDSLSKQISAYMETVTTKLTALKMRLFFNSTEKQFVSTNVFDLISDSKNLSVWLQVKGASTIMQKLVTDSAGGSTRDCHQEAHILGRASYTAFKGESFKMGTGDCHSGFYHGAMEGLLKEKGTVNLAANIDKVCDLFKTAFGHYECLHGVGHGVMAYENYDLLKAIDTCKELSTPFAQRSCYGGVFMENIMTNAFGDETHADHTTKWLSDDPHFPCNALFETRPEAIFECYQMQTSRMLAVFGSDYKKVSEACEQAVGNMQLTCFQSLGRDAAGITLRDAKKTIEICDLVPKNYFSQCINGAIQVVVDFWGENIGSYPYNFCAAISEPTERDSCFQIVFSRLEGLFGRDKEKIIASCQLANDYKDSCVKFSQHILEE